MYCGHCGNKNNKGGYCSACKYKTLVTMSGFEKGFSIPQVPMSFNDSVKNYGMMMYKSGHVMHLIPNLGTNTSFGNLTLIFMNILQDIEYLNDRIKEAYHLYAIGMYYDLNQDVKLTDHLRTVEEVVYWMRRIVDRLISLHWLIYDQKNNNKYSERIKIDCIGSLLKLNSQDIFKKKYSKNNIFFLKFLNEVSNAYKHSFLNDEGPSTYVGQEEPLVIALGLQYNDSKKQMKYKHDSLSNLIVAFISFYKDIREVIKKELS